MRILVTGSTNFHAYYRIHRAMQRARIDSNGVVRRGIVLVTSGRQGAECGAIETAEDMGWEIELHEASGRRNRIINNQRMLHKGVDLCLAFLTRDAIVARDCAARAEKMGIPTWKYYGLENENRPVEAFNPFSDDMESAAEPTPNFNDFFEPEPYRNPVAAMADAAGSASYIPPTFWDFLDRPEPEEDW